MDKPNGMPGQWPTSTLDYHSAHTPPLVMSPNVNGPVDPHEFYMDFGSPTAEELEEDLLPSSSPYRADSPPTARTHHAPSRSFSRSPTRTQLRSASGPAGTGGHTLSNARSNPVLLPSRQPGNVKDLANRIDRGTGTESRLPALAINTSRDRYKPPTFASKSGVQKSPTGGPSSDSRPGVGRLQKRRPGPRSPTKSPSTSFETTSSFSSTATARTSRSQPQPTSSPKKGPYTRSRPLFGEITSNGTWTGNFDLGNYAPLPAFGAVRRSSEGSAALGHGRSQSHQDFSQPRQKLSHKRSRSDMDALSPHIASNHMPSLSSSDISRFYATPEEPPKRASPKTSRIPVISRQQSYDSTASNVNSRSASAMSNPSGRGRLSKSPTRIKPASGKENTPSSAPRSRYNPPAVPSAQSNQLLSAKIVAPPPKTSPPLRSSRPRQPVSSATTSASRARAAERFQNTVIKDGRSPSEQWLGKPYDPQKERSKRKIPELGKIDFEERRARIQKAISQNLESSQSQESLRSQTSQSRNVSGSHSRLASLETGRQASGGAEVDALMVEEQLAASSLDREEDSPVLPQPDHSRGLSLDTDVVRAPDADQAPPLTGRTDQTEHTVFEDESPIFGRPTQETPKPRQLTHEEPLLLSSATYKPPVKAQPPTIQIPEGDRVLEQPLTSPSVLENVLRMRQRSASSMNTASEHPDESPPALHSPGDTEGRWGLSPQGSIKIMLDQGLTVTPQSATDSTPWPEDIVNRIRDVQNHGHMYEDELLQARQYNRQAYDTNGIVDSPVDEPESFTEDSPQATPRKPQHRNDTLKPAIDQQGPQSANPGEEHATGAVARVLNHYQSTGTLTAEMLQDMQHHMVDLNRMSANGGSNAFMVQNLLDSILDEQAFQREHSARSSQGEDSVQLLRPITYEMPLVTPDTPPLEEFTPGTVLVYQPESGVEVEDDEIQANMRKADVEWQRQQQSDGDGTSDALAHAVEHRPPPPPPKDLGYTPRLSTGPSAAFLPPPRDSLRISTLDSSDFTSTQASGERDIPSHQHQHVVSPVSPAPPLPSHAPPVPPPGMSEGLMEGAISGRASSEASPHLRKDTWGTASSSRPSVDSQRLPASLPGSQSMSSIGESTRHASIDAGADSDARLVKTNSPGPEQKRLLKRRHIIKELLDTEYTYHQDLKIVEDIYKGTCNAELVAPEDKKVLFGNCDEVEAFSLAFYDDMRKAANPIYIPSKSQRWAGKRSSQATTQSDGTSQTNTVEYVDDEKDRQSSVGRCFLEKLPDMEKVYTSYLKNHDAANKRLDAIKDVPTVKCWLIECQTCASDITTAWNLDSLLVKPTQRIVKYPLLLTSLLETTPPDHPDHEDLKAAAMTSIEMLTRINDAKKREELVNAIINPKPKQGVDLRSGFYKIVGRRTEKLKERVGIAELYQDTDFDELAHKFGGHFIRLQICMRDVQDYMNRTDKAIELISNYAGALELYTDVSPSRAPEIESKWRRYGQVIRDLTVIAFGEHKAQVVKRVLGPMVQCIKLHEGPQNAINKRKKRVVDYAKCKAEERRGLRPDKKLVEAAESFTALNDQLKIELPKLYNLTATLVQNCLHCFLDAQLQWQSTWERKLRPVLEVADFPDKLTDIESAFKPDYLDAQAKCLQLGICNGTLKAEAANYLSPQPNFVDSMESSSDKRRTSTLDSSDRTLSVGSDVAGTPDRRHSGSHSMDAKHYYSDNRIRSNSSMSTRAPSQTPSSAATSRPWSNTVTPHTSYSTSRPTTATASQASSYHMMRASSDNPRSPRPGSNATYFTARPDPADGPRFSGIFTSALPTEAQTSRSRPSTPQHADADTPVLFVCASLFEFSIDRARREGGYPYLTYVQGEVFDVVAQKGELWLAKNQDDAANQLGWIWEQHFVILSQSDQ